MKKQIQLATVMIVAGASLMGGCNGNNAFKTTESGLQYKFESLNSSAQQVQLGDVIVGELTVKFDSMELFSNVGHADRILQAMAPTFEGDLNEGLVMLHVGDKAVFAVDADRQAQYLNPGQMPPTYKKGAGMKFYYTLSVQDIVTKEELATEQANYMAQMQERREAEPELIANYIAENNISVKPNADGVYIIVKKKGTGERVAAGRTVAMNYTGRLLDGTMFDSSVEGDARQGGIYQAGRQYEPLTYVVGKMGLIKGWEQGVMGQPAGTVLQIVMPSAMGYGPQGAGNTILPYSPLVFDIEIVSVK